MKDSAPRSTNNNIKISFESEQFDIQAKLTNGEIVSAEVDSGFTSIIIAVSTTDKDGELKITLPRQLIDATTDNRDDDFIVLVDGDEVDFDETDRNLTERTLIIPIPARTEEIEIIGTSLGLIEILPEIIFDKEEYTPFDEMLISIVSPSSNTDPNRREGILANVSTAQSRLDKVEFYETGANTGIFERSVRLTPNKSKFKGDLEVSRDTQVNVEFVVNKDTVASKSVLVDYHEGIVSFDKDAYRLNETVVIKVIDPDENRSPDSVDTVHVHVKSTSDEEGLHLTLKETGSKTGVFEGKISLSSKSRSKSKKLRVSEGDTITAIYVEKTLPAPAELNDDGITTAVKEIFTKALVGALVPPIERLHVSELELVDQTGTSIEYVEVGQQVLVQAQIENHKNKKLTFAFILQVKDSDGFTESLSWMNGTLPARGLFKVAQSWIPKKAGYYTLESFVWQGIDNPVALSPVRSISVKVSKKVIRQ